ncbi:MAG: hypothetical protein C4547_10250 [Phycisphaerales bacterium]|nr:MAG: hypothetical protein C4547_10250 [Phycisphaerales bacterium]
MNVRTIVRRLPLALCILVAVACWLPVLAGRWIGSVAGSWVFGEAGYVHLYIGDGRWMIALASPNLVKTGDPRGYVIYDFLTDHAGQMFTGGTFTRPQDWPITQAVRFDRLGAKLWFGTVPNVLSHEFTGSEGTFHYGAAGDGASVSLTAARFPSLWPAALATLIPIIALIRGPLRRVLRRRRGRCGHCGYDLTGNTTGTCPECGRPDPSRSARPRSEDDGGRPAPAPDSR